MKLLTLSACILFFLADKSFAGQWLMHHNEEIKGQVVESDTHKPIEGALIIALWKLEDVLNEGPGGFERVEVVESGKDGHFVIPSWTSFKPWQVLYKVSNVSPYILIFKPGFKITNSNRPAREGFPNDTSISEEGKRVIAKRYGLEPAKLEKIITEKERLESFDALERIEFPGRHFSKKQLIKIFIHYEQEVNNLSENVKNKRQLQKNICNDKNFYISRGECE